MLALEQAIYAAIGDAMREDPRVLLMGEGVATLQPALLAEFGPQAVRNTPLAEASIAGCAVGAAAMGLRPVVDLLYAPFLMLAMDALVNHAGKLGALSGGQWAFPLLVIARSGAGYGVGSQHHHNLEALFAHVPGLQVLMPSTPADAQVLTREAIRSGRPTLLFADIGLLHQPGPVQGSAAAIGRALVRRSGADITFVGYGKTVATCLAAAGTLQAQDVEAEVIDLVSIKPMDRATLLGSLRKTRRLAVVTEASGLCGVAAELAALAAESVPLRAPVLRLTGPDAPVPAAFHLEQASVPGADELVARVRRLLGAGRAVAEESLHPS
jgi:acetoin:2,6-dichlorophenolindophenol oxidoreductase subunit beta